MLEAKYFEALVNLCGKDSVLVDASMKNYTTMKVGGIADLMVQPDTIEGVKNCVAFLSCNDIPFLVMGNGSNLIFPDDGFRGVILKIGSRLSKIKVKDELIIAEGGASLASVSAKALENALTGLEFASGIPGSIGGAACMNAGAYDGEMKQVIIKTLCVDSKGNLIILEDEEHNFSYRHSKIQDDELICIEVTLKLSYGDADIIKSKMLELNSRRKDKQPLELPSSGSTFKRPPGHFAGKLIEDCGLRGYSIGGAQVSVKHCGFIVNSGNATSEDVISLIKHVQETVLSKTGVMLEPEVKIIRGT